MNSHLTVSSRTLSLRGNCGRKRSERGQSALLLVLLVAILGVSSSPLAAANRSLSVSSTSIDFGNQLINTTQQNVITLSNAGSRPLQIRNVVLSNANGFTVTGWGGSRTLGPAQSFQLGVTFSPVAVRHYLATLTIVVNNAVDPVVTLQGAGAAPAGISISPTAATLQGGASQQFQASESGATSPSVTWAVNGMQGGNSAVGTISSAGLYKAPNVSSSSSVQVSAADGAAQASAAVTIMPVPPAISVSISPASTSLQVGQSQQFTSTVTGTTNTAVNWLVSGVAGGNATVGTISAGGLYTAPAGVPSGAVTVTAQSVYQSSASATASVTIGPGYSSDLSWAGSTSPVSGYNVYRGTVSGGPYTKINSSLQSGTSYADSNVLSGKTYFYVTTSVDSGGVESVFSNEVSATIP